MEENNNNFIIKGLAIILIAILVLNVYRTETIKKELTDLSDTLSQVQSQIDFLEYPEVGHSSAPAVPENSQIIRLEKRFDNLESKVSNLQSSVERLSKAPSHTSTRTSVNPGVSSNGTTATSGTKIQNGRVSVSAKVKVENRYVRGTTYVPNVTKGPSGIVIVDVTINRIGMVGSVSINRGSTISDEDILDLCKEAALKTEFAYNPEAPDKSRGTITYTFTAK